jgi:hypothetical protein
MGNSFFTSPDKALQYLLEKYQVKQPGSITDDGVLEVDGKGITLLPWRMERRFIELKKIIDDNTLEDISTFRFALLTSSSTASLDDLILQELDICEWLGNSPIARIFAVFHEDNAMNAIVKLENRFSCSVECSTMLPAGAANIDRHEIIARRGVASDQVVDTHVPQSSIYTYTPNNEQCFTDVDAEIFGLSPKNIYLVRASFQVLSEPRLIDEWAMQYRRLLGLVKIARHSETDNKSSNCRGCV